MSQAGHAKGMRNVESDSHSLVITNLGLLGENISIELSRRAIVSSLQSSGRGRKSTDPSHLIAQRLQQLGLRWQILILDAWRKTLSSGR